jgi:prepilin-type N-terminal cleavage/methylation domain-containing protein
MRSDVKKRVVGEEAGFTLTEVLVTMMIMLIVLFALYSIFDMSIRVFTFGNDKVEATEQARLGMEKMEREIRAAYPVDRINGKEHVFFPSGFADPANSEPTRPEEQSITFGNDLPSAEGVPPNRMVDPEEAITYELRNSDGIAACPNVGTEGICTVFRREGSGGTFEPLVEYVVPNNGNGEPGLTFEYLRNNMAPTDPVTFPDGTDIGVVRITLKVKVDRVEQTLTTDVDLRNRGG